MDFQHRLKVLRRSVARYGLFGSSWLVNRLPYKSIKVMAQVFIAIGLCFTKRLQRVALESLTIAFGNEKDEREIKRIIRTCFENMGRGMFENLYYIEHPSEALTKVSVEGLNHLEQALAKGNGVVAVTAHFGNFPLMMVKFAQEGYKTNVLMRTTRDKKIDAFLLERRTRIGIKTIYSLPRKACVQKSLKALRNNEIVFMLIDQNFGSDGGVFVDFFGQKAATATGPIVFAERAKAPILPIFIIRQESDMHKIIIEPPFEIETKATDKETQEYNIARITKLIESYVRRYPQEWGWMHRRWKTKKQ